MSDTRKYVNDKELSAYVDSLFDAIRPNRERSKAIWSRLSLNDYGASPTVDEFLSGSGWRSHLFSTALSTPHRGLWFGSAGYDSLINTWCIQSTNSERHLYEMGILGSLTLPPNSWVFAVDPPPPLVTEWPPDTEPQPEIAAKNAAISG